MTERWLSNLEQYLQKMPFEDRFDLVMNYKEQIQIMKETGLTDDIIIKKLGPAKQVASELMSSFNDDDTTYQTDTTKQNIKDHLTSATKEFKNIQSPLLKITYWALFLLYLVAAFSIFVVGIALSLSSILLFIFTFPILNLSLGIFFVLLAMSILLFNLGLILSICTYRLSRLLYKKLI